MKKITLFLMSLLISVGAMAQFESGKYYRIKDIASRNYLNAADNNTHATGPKGGVNVIALDASSNDMVFTAEASGDGYKLKTKTGYYLNGHEWNVDANSTTDGMELLFEPVTDGYKIKWISTASKYLGQTKYFKVESVDGIIYPFCDASSDNAATWAIEEVNADAYAYNTGNINRGDRGLTSFTITDGENSLTVSDIQTSAQAPVYVNKTAQKLITKQGATLKFSAFNYTGSWMHAYAYIDYNKDYVFYLTDNNRGTKEGEIVSYNYYNGNDITGTPANQGSAIGNTYGESKAMPAFTLPRNLPAGEYRVRIKIDWNNLDADYGASDIAANGGCQCDFTIVVEEAVGNEIAWDALNNAVDEAFALFNAVKIGTAVGSYSSSINGYEKEFNDIVSYKSSITEATPSDEIDSYTARVREIIASFSLNMPKAGDYFRIKAIEGWNDDARYLGAKNSTENTSRAEFVAEADNNTIFYFDGENLVSYASGHYLVNNSSFLGYNGVQTNGTKVEFRTSNNTSNRHAYNISFKGNDNATRWLYTDTGNFTDAGSSCGTEGGYNFNLEPVTELPVTITSAGYASFYAPVQVTLPEGVTAHTVTENGEWAKLSDAITIVPAKNGVILAGGEGTYNLEISNEDVENLANALSGTIAKTLVTKTDGDAYYMLGMVEGVVGLYNPVNDANATEFYNASHKAYWHIPAVSQTIGFRFGGETTAIDAVEVENANAPIYDLSGRRVLNAVKGGIYIQNGKKFIVK